MTLTWIEGFEFLHGNDAFFQAKYTTFNSSIVVSIGTGRFFGKSAHNPNFAFRPFTARDDWTIGFALNEAFTVPGTNTYDPNYYIGFLNGGVEQFTLKFKRVTDNSYKLAILRDSTEIAVGNRVFYNSEGWHYIEIYFNATNTGDLELRVDGFTDISITGEDLQADTTSGVDSIGFALSGDLDDLYFNSGQEFLGEQIVEGIQFMADEGTNEWTPAGSNPKSDHFENVAPNSNPVNNYLESDVATEHESFILSPEVVAQGQLSGYQLDLFAELDAAGSEDMHLEGGSIFSVSSTAWQHHGEVREVTSLPTQQGFERD